MQRTATPCTPVRFRPQPPFYIGKVHPSNCPGGEIGRRKGLKIPREKSRAGSIPAPGTNKIKELHSNSIWRLLKDIIK